MPFIVRIVLTVDGAPGSKKIPPAPLAALEIASFELADLGALRRLAKRLHA